MIRQQHSLLLSDRRMWHVKYFMFHLAIHSLFNKLAINCKFAFVNIAILQYEFGPLANHFGWLNSNGSVVPQVYLTLE